MLPSNLRRNFCLAMVLCALMLSQALPAMAHSLESKAPQSVSILLSQTADRCSGTLYVLNNAFQWQRITRGVWTTVYVNVDGQGFWHWRCGSTNERSRSAILPYQVHMLNVFHSTQNANIGWRAYS